MYGADGFDRPCLGRPGEGPWHWLQEARANWVLGLGLFGHKDEVYPCMVSRLRKFRSRGG